MDLALFVDHQSVHVLVGSDVHRAAIDFRAGGEGIEEQFVTAFHAVAVDQLQGVAIEGSDGAAHGVDHQVAIERHAHAEGGIHWYADAVLGLFIVEQFFWQLHLLGELHTRLRVFVVVLINAEHPARTGADEGVIAGQQRIDCAANQLIGGAGQHAVGLRIHVVQQAFLVLGFKELTGLGSLLKTLFRRDRLVVGQFHRQVDAGHFSEFEVVFDLHLAQRKPGPEPVHVGIADLVGVLHQAARFVGQYTVGVRRHLVGTAWHGNAGAVGRAVVPVRLVVVGLRQIRVDRRALAGSGQYRDSQAGGQKRPM
ncbi:hypothetical protein D3C85_623080 [compost metagenome]